MKSAKSWECLRREDRSSTSATRRDRPPTFVVADRERPDSRSSDPVELMSFPGIGGQRGTMMPGLGSRNVEMVETMVPLNQDHRQRASRASWLVAVLLLVVTAVHRPAHAQMPSSASDVARIQVHADARTIHPGETVHVVVLFTLSPHWHVYWKNPGASGAPTDLSLTVPEGFTVGPTQMPRPQRFSGPEGVTWGYEREVAFFVPITAPKTLEAGELTIPINAFYLVCREACLMGNEDLTISLSTASTPRTAAKRATDERLITQHRARLPKAMKALRGASISYRDGVVRLEGPAGDGVAVSSIPHPSPGVSPGAAEVVILDGRFVMTIPVDVEPNNAMGKPMFLDGLLILGAERNAPVFEFHCPIPASGAPAP